MYMRSDFAVLRVRKDVNELSKAKFTCPEATTHVDFPDGVNNMLRLIFTVSIAPDAPTPFANGDFTFFVEIPKTYPFHAPSVKCLTRVWHPNVDITSGRVMMPILGPDWRPVLCLNTVLLGLQLIFLEPGTNYVLNNAAAQQLHENPEQFTRQMQQILCGGRFYGMEFPAHPRQIARQRQSWGLRVKRARDDEWDGSGSPRSTSSNLCVTQSAAETSLFMDFNGASAWKRKRID